VRKNSLLHQYFRIFSLVLVIPIAIACSISFSYFPEPTKPSTQTPNPTYTPSHTLTLAPAATPTLSPTPTETNLFNLLDHIEQIEELASINAVGESREGISGKIRFSPDGRILAIPALQSIYLYLVPSFSAGSNFYTGGNVSDMEFTPDGKQIASGSWDRYINLWNVNDGSHYLELEMSTTDVNSIDISPGGNLIASGGGDSIN
jgi:WD40 repeat protein